MAGGSDFEVTAAGDPVAPAHRSAVAARDHTEAVEVLCHLAAEEGLRASWMRVVVEVHPEVRVCRLVAVGQRQKKAQTSASAPEEKLVFESKQHRYRHVPSPRRASAPFNVAIRRDSACLSLASAPGFISWLTRPTPVSASLRRVSVWCIAAVPVPGPNP